MIYGGNCFVSSIETSLITKTKQTLNLDCMFCVRIAKNYYEYTKNKYNETTSSLLAARDEIRSKNIVNAKGLSPDEGRRKYG